MGVAIRFWLLGLVCLALGHQWVEHLEYEWAGYPVHASTWRDCSRCERYEETWNIYDAQKAGGDRVR